MRPLRHRRIPPGTGSGRELSYRRLYAVIEAVCRALREQPLRMLEGRPCEARAYVAEVLTRAFPDVAANQVVRWCGSRNLARDAAHMAALMAGPHWRESVVDIGLRALGREDLSMDRVLDCAAPAMPAAAPVGPTIVVAPPSIEVVALRSPPRPAPPAPTPAPAGPLSRPSPPRRIIDRRPASAIVAFGEPDPGRSALAQREAAREAAQAAAARSIRSMLALGLGVSSR